MAESKLVLMKTKKSPTWEEWNKLKIGERTMKTRIPMTQTEAASILDAVSSADTTEQAYELLGVLTPDRKHLSHWLGQIGHRQAVKLGNGRDFRQYVRAVVDSLRYPTRINVMSSMEEQEGPMKERIVENKNECLTDADGISDLPVGTGESIEREPPMNMERVEQEGSEKSPPLIDHTSTQCKESSEISPAPYMSRVQDYAIRNLKVYADCAVQKDETGVFHVIARNFDTNGLMWFLRKVGKSHLADRIKGKDTVDAIRKAAYELHRELKADVGKPIARW